MLNWIKRAYLNIVRLFYSKSKPTTSGVKIDYDITYNGERVTFELHNMAGFTDKEADKYRRAVSLMVTVLNLYEFHDWFLNFQFEPYPSEYLPGNMTNKDMLDLIMSGKDMFGEADNDIDIDIKLYTKNWSKVIGYTYYTSIKTWINRKFFRQYTVAKIAGNIVHEALHNVGFKHSYKYNTRRKNTVPYAVGYKVAEIAAKYV